MSDIEPRRGPGRPRKRILIPRVGHEIEAGHERAERYHRTGKKKSRGQEVWGWIERACFVPEGASVGQPLKLLDWEKSFIEEIYDNPHGPTRRAILSVGRKNGKTTLIACLLLVHLCGPEGRKRPNSQIFSAAQSRDQAALVFNLAAKMVRLNPILRQAILIHESSKALSFPDHGTRYRALSAEATTAYGLSPALVIHDELGLVRGPRSELYEALETATGAQAEPLSIIISTQAPTDADLLSILIDDAMAGHDPSVVCRLYTVPKELDAFDPATIAQANPSLGKHLSLKEVLAQAESAKRMPASESSFRNLVLNQRVVVENPFCAPEVWARCKDMPGSLEGVSVYGGLDLSEHADLTALVLIGKADGKRWSVKPTFWLPSEGLIEKSQIDRTPWDMWHAQGFLETTPGPTISYEYIAQYLREMFGRYKIQKIAFDRWHFNQLRPWLVKAGMGENFITEHFQEFGQGYQSMAPAMRELSSILQEGNLCHGDHPVLKSSVANTIVVLDDAGNRKPSKRKSTGRIDGLVALLMAVGVAPQAPAIDVSTLIA